MDKYRRRYIAALAFWIVALTAPAATPSFGSFNTNQFGTNGNQITIRSGALTTNGVISDATIGYRTNTTERIYAVESWGALGDGVETLNATMGAGSAGLTNTTVTFPTDIVGKSFTMYGAGTNGWNLSGVVLARVSATVLTLSTNATVAQTNRFVYGTDDMAAINLAHDWLATNGLGGTLGYTPGKIYCLGTNLLDPGAPTNHYNAQLRVPYVVQTAGAPTIRITGFQKPSGTYDNNGSGRSAVIWSFYPRGQDGANVASVLTVNSLSGLAVGNLKERMNRARFVVDNITFRHAHDNNMRIVDLYAAQQANVLNLNVESGYGSTGVEPPVQTGTNGMGLVMPNSVNYNENSAENVVFYGTYNGMSPCNLMKGEGFQFYYVVNCYQPFDNVIGSTFTMASAMECSNVFSLPAQVWNSYVSGLHIYNSTRFVSTRNLIFAPQNSFLGTLVFKDGNPVSNSKMSIIGDASKAMIIQERGDYHPIFYTTIHTYTNIVASNTVTASAAYIGSLHSGGRQYGSFGVTNGLYGLLVGPGGDTYITGGAGQGVNFMNNGISLSVGSATANLWTFSTAVNVTSGRITNGNSVWFDRTNIAPPASLNRVWLATDTNDPTAIFVGNNGVWTKK